MVSGHEKSRNPRLAHANLSLTNRLSANFAPRKQCLPSACRVPKDPEVRSANIRSNALRLVLNAMVSGSVYSHGVIRID
jgi:hypothetical protein